MAKTRYTTIQGDMWDGISYKLYGSEKYMDKLIEANPAHRYTVIFSAGVTLSVPEINTATTSTKLPPWKKVSG